MKFLLSITIIFLSATSANCFDIFGVGPDQFEIEFASIGDPGNFADTTGIPNPVGAVDYSFRMGKYEISEEIIDRATAQSMALGNALNLSHDNRGGNRPATSLTWLDAARFVNFLNTSTGNSEAYKFDTAGNFFVWDAADVGYNPNNRYRNTQAKYFLPSVDEWYKSAYYNPSTGEYYDYPTGSNNTPDGIDFVGDTNFDAVFNDGAQNLMPNAVKDVGVLRGMSH